MTNTSRGGVRSVGAYGLVEKGTFRQGPQQLEKLIVQYGDDWHPGLRGKEVQRPCGGGVMACLKSRKEAVWLELTEQVREC